jgi:hypothetical protein
LLVTLACAAACCFASARLFALLSPEAPAMVVHPPLTFGERVDYQRAIEEVYWRHRTWPSGSPDAKPSLDTMASRAQSENKVADYLRSSQALDHYWQRPITAEQLQAEMNRMAAHTKQPEVLRQLFQALGNDPFVVAECLARPTLAQRELTSSYAYDQRIHGQLRERAHSDLLAHPAVDQMTQTSGTYSEIDFVRRNGSADKRPGGEGAIKLSTGEWDATVQKLAATFDEPASLKASSVAEEYENIPVGELSALQETETSYYATAVTKKAVDWLKVARVEWPKESLQSWQAETEKQVSTVVSAANPPTAFRQYPVEEHNAPLIHGTRPR